MRIFVTGGSGYIGRNIIRALVKRGDTIRALARSVQSGEVVDALGATVIPGDLDNGNALRQGMDGCDAVIHCAVLGNLERDPIALHRVNVAGTQHVIAACQAMHIPRLIHLSTDAIIADGKPKIHIDETTPYRSKPTGLYSLTKMLAEKMTIAANSPELNTIVIRPHLVWGKDDTVWLPRLITQVQSGLWFWINGGHHLTATCHVDNAVEGILMAIDNGRGGEIYALTDGDPVEYRNFVTNLLKTQHITPPDRSINRRLAMSGTRLSEMIIRRFNLNRDPPMTRSELIMIGCEFTINDSKAREQLGYQGSITREQGLADMAKRFLTTE